MTEDGHDALDVLDAFRQEAGLSHGELWLRYFELGGMSTGFDVEAFLYGVLAPSSHDHDVIAQALNERFADRQQNLEGYRDLLLHRANRIFAPGAGFRREG